MRSREEGGAIRKKIKATTCCDPTGKGISAYRVESLITVDDRGQMVLPKELRDKAGIKGGDKLAVISWGKDGQVCYLSLIKVEEFSGMVKDILGPLMGELHPKG